MDLIRFINSTGYLQSMVNHISVYTVSVANGYQAQTRSSIPGWNIYISGLYVCVLLLLLFTIFDCMCVMFNINKWSVGNQ